METPNEKAVREFFEQMDRELAALPKISDWAKMTPEQRICARGNYLNVCAEGGNFPAHD